MKKSLIIVLVIGVIVFGGLFYLYWRQSVTENAAQTAQDLPAVVKTTKSSKQKSETSKDYLVIKEWGVRFTLTEGIKDARVVYRDGKPFGLTTASVEKFDGCKNAEIRSLRRAKLNEDIAYEYTVKQALKDQMGGITKIGEYYYALWNPGWACSKEGQKVIMEDVVELNKAFNNSLESAN